MAAVWLARIVRRALPAAVLICGTPALALVPSHASVAIEAAPSADVIQNILSQANIVVTVIGAPAAETRLSSASLATGSEETLQFTASAMDMAPSNGLILARDAVSVNVTPMAMAGPSGNIPGSVIVVLAQYN